MFAYIGFAVGAGVAGLGGLFFARELRLYHGSVTCGQANDMRAKGFGAIKMLGGCALEHGYLYGFKTAPAVRLHQIEVEYGGVVHTGNKLFGSILRVLPEVLLGKTLMVRGDFTEGIRLRFGTAALWDRFAVRPLRFRIATL